ncbi:ABC transporter substrate-binding protein [Prosthecochloris sp. GSB1]|uniref:ABC transporter substrate-binding protein n=1 Tax=Prosthecochloris sp. GSB1 TaxID=281093 RepID=UPI001F279180|nr:ABC transporter substrate-binding protein [Prosthecochloris sp. GSB1]
MSSISIDGMRGLRDVSKGQGRSRVLLVPMLFFVGILFCSCTAQKEKAGAAPEAGVGTGAVFEDVFDISYAKGFMIREHSGVRTIKVRAGLQGRQDTLRYLLLPRGAAEPEGFDGYMVIRTPVRSVAVFSTTHIGYIDLLGCSDRIAGVARPEIVNTRSVRRKIEAGLICEIGMPFSPNLEVILDLDPDLVIATVLPPSRKAEYNALVDAGIPVLVVSEWLESSPIGRAEWLKMYGAFLGKNDEALEKFRGIERSYLDLAALTDNVSSRPSVITGLPFKDAWFVPGGDSYVARLLRDAGAEYHWSDQAKTGSMKMDIESVYPVALQAEIWLSPGTVLTRDELLAKDERFSDFPSVRAGRVYNNNRQINPAGGNAYWEHGVVQPDRILKDLIMILHPDIAIREGFGSDSLTFFRRID